jgi:hypothetical protein
MAPVGCDELLSRGHDNSESRMKKARADRCAGLMI